MQRIGLLSDTHGFLHPDIPRIFGACDQIWHAGDIGSIEIIHKLSEIKPVRGVFGNIDGQDLRLRFPKYQRFVCEEVDVLMMHIGGYPGKYARDVVTLLNSHPPHLFICGHSHILKVQYDYRYKLLHINPGAAGKQGFHKVITLVRFCITGKKIHDLEVVELDKA